MRRILKLVVWLLVLMLAVYIGYFIEFPFNNIVAAHVYHSLINFIIFAVFLKLLFRIVRFFYLKKNGAASTFRDNITNGLSNLYTILFGIGLVVTIFGLLGINLKALLTSLSIVAAAIAIIMKEFIHDLIVGIYISFTKDFEIGDYVKIENQRGKILEIGLLKLKLLNDDDDIVFIPNTKVYAHEIVNFTRRDIRLMNISFQLDIHKIHSIERLEIALKETLSPFSEFIQDNSYNLKIVAVKKDYLDLKFQYTLTNMDRDVRKRIRRKTIRKVFNYISES